MPADTPPPDAVPEHPDEPLLTLLADRCRCPAPVLPAERGEARP